MRACVELERERESWGGGGGGGGGERRRGRGMEKLGGKTTELLNKIQKLNQQLYIKFL